VIISVHQYGQRLLSDAIDTRSLSAFFFGPSHRRQQQGGQDGDNCNDHEEFNQAEAGLSPFRFRPVLFAEHRAGN
jgi:hypothetical protein